MSGWRKSARSGGNGQCVEVGSFRKASHSVNNGQCTEVGSAPGAVLVRDPTDRQGVTLAVAPGAWKAFTGALRSGQVPS